MSLFFLDSNFISGFLLKGCNKCAYHSKFSFRVNCFLICIIGHNIPHFLMYDLLDFEVCKMIFFVFEFKVSSAFISFKRFSGSSIQEMRKYAHMFW